MFHSRRLRLHLKQLPPSTSSTKGESKIMRTLLLTVLFAGLSAVTMSGTAHAQACGTIGTETRLEVVLLTSDQRLFCYIERTVFARPMGPIVGLDANETLLGIDFRPANGLLYGIGNLGGSYVLVPNVAMGNVTATKLANITVADATGAPQPGMPVTLMGTTFGVDFNPVPDRLRVISDAGQNLRINVITGATNVDTALTPTGVFAGAAYTNNDVGVAATNTVLYTINSMTDQLNIQSPPNNGNQVAVGATGVDAGPSLAFDIFTVTQGTPPTALRNRGIALLSTPGATMGTTVTNLFQINLETGAATLLPIPGGAGFNVPLTGMAIPLAQTGTVVF
jgi:hypothetical protein